MADPSVTCDMCGAAIPPDAIANSSALSSPIKSCCAACVAKLSDEQRAALRRAASGADSLGGRRRSSFGMLVSLVFVSGVFWASVAVAAYFIMKATHARGGEEAVAGGTMAASPGGESTAAGGSDAGPVDDATETSRVIEPNADAATARAKLAGILEMMDAELDNYDRVVVLLEAFPHYFPGTPEAEDAARLLEEVRRQHAEQSTQTNDDAGTKREDEPGKDDTVRRAPTFVAGTPGEVAVKKAVGGEVRGPGAAGVVREEPRPSYTTLNNILANGGFETRAEKGRFAAGWKPHRWDDGGGRFTARIDESNVHSGEHALVVRVIGEGGRAGAYRTLALAPGEYEISFWAAGDLETEATVGAALGEASAVMRTVGEDWRRVTGRVTVAKRLPNVSLRLWSEAANTRVWFDDVRLCRVMDGPPPDPDRDPKAPTKNRGLIAHWTMDDVVAGRVIDCSGNENHAYVHGPGPVTGHLGEALSFAGPADYVDVPDHDSLDAFPLSITAWVRVQPGAAANAIVNRYKPFSFENGYEVVFAGGVVRGVYCRDNANKIHAPGGFGRVSLDDGEWHHVAVVFDEMGGALFVDTSFIARIPWTGEPGGIDSTRSLRLGLYAERGGRSSFAGELDDVRLYARAIGAREIETIASGRHVAGAEPLDLGGAKRVGKELEEADGATDGAVARTIDGSCPACDGTGLLKTIGCPTCACMGWLRSKRCEACGGKAVVEYPCPGCKGSGKVTRGGKVGECGYCKGRGYLACYWCKGSGKIKRPNPEAAPFETVVCQRCGGNGIETHARCARCAGTGKMRLQVSIPRGLVGTRAHRRIRCTRCGGSGEAPPSCPACGGRGYQGAGRSVVPCRACSGTGTHFTPCLRCRGAGYVRAPAE